MTRVKGHYRHLANGVISRIDEYFDRRKSAKTKMPGHVVHADEESTSIVGPKGEIKTLPHSGEMSQEQIHGHLNKPLPVNADLAAHVIKHQLGVKDHGQFLKDAAEEEGYKSKPRFKDEEGAKDWFHETHVAPKLKELRQAHGKTTTRAKAYLASHKDLREMWQAQAGDKSAPAHAQAEGQLLAEHAESAHQEAAEALEQGIVARGKGPDQAPKIHSLSPSVKFFGHQAQALAQMFPTLSSICDVDMGGGKGLILPADALALMTAGKAKKPLIVVPAATLDQNADKLADEYSNGKVNVFKLSHDSLKKHHGGHIEDAVVAIKSAPANTVFMATFDVIAHQDRDPGAAERFPHAAALASAGFDVLSIDECHNVNNEDSARFQALTHLAGAKYKRMASGTFLANDPRGVVGPLKLLYPAMDLDQKKLEQFYGRREGKGDATWSPEGLKKLRENLLDLGMVSLRRSAWMDKLPKRKDALSVVQMEPEQKRVHEAVLHDALDQLEEEAKTDPLLARALADDSLDNAWEAPPALMRRLEIMQGVTDYPDEMAKVMEGNLSLVAGSAEKGSPDYREDSELAEAVETLKKFSPAARNALLSLKGTVSAKAKDVYKKAAAHLKDPKNGKFIVFCQRKASARHILDNMPADLGREAMYFDASKMGDLGQFTDQDGGPRLLVAVDASIKEGVNLQRANGLYRYDHHLTPGNQEQSYARIWRFGQDKPTSIHLGIVDGGMDVTKYARLCSKGHVNQQVVSDFESDRKTPIFKLSLDNLRNKRDASMLDDYQELVDEVLRFQQGENKTYKAKFGDKPYDLASGGNLPGSKPAAGGPYHKPKNLKKAWLMPTPEMGLALKLLKSIKQAHGETLANRRLDDADMSKMSEGVDIFARQVWTAAKASKLSRFKLPSHVGSAYDAIGEKITNISEDKRERVKEIVQEAIEAKQPVEHVARRLRHSVNSGGHSGDDRDWQMVAQTEISNARAHAALDHIIATYGADALVNRQTNKCCPTCCHAFGRHVKRTWRAGSIPDKFKGAVHPRCKCGPWRLLNPMKRMNMRKALAAGASKPDWPMGLIRRQAVVETFGMGFAISTGYGRWASLDSITGRAVLRAVLARTPLVVISDRGRQAIARVGYGRCLVGASGKTGSYVLVDPLKAKGARYYPRDPGSMDASFAGTAVKTRDDFVNAMLQVLPVVAGMPELWPPGRTMVPATDLLGYRTLSDWWVVLPHGVPSPEDSLAIEPAGASTARELVRRWNKRLLNQDSLAKDGDLWA